MSEWCATVMLGLLAPAVGSAGAGDVALDGDPDYGRYLSSECVTCHQVDGTDRGIPSITGRPTGEFTALMQAYKTSERDHPVMRMIARRLSDEEIAHLAAYFESAE